MCMVTSGGRFNIRRRSLALAGPPISAKKWGGGEGVGVRLFGTVRLFKRIRYLNCLRPFSHTIDRFEVQGVVKNIYID